MSPFLEKCKQYFGTDDFYEILHVERDASNNAIKKGYHKISLVVHPDRVEEAKKDLATEKFKIISRIYSVLSDEDKRKVYDEGGDFSEEGGDSLLEWMNLWRSMFKPIHLSDIDEYKKQYINSEQERRDIKRAYEATKGKMTKMHDLICFMDCDSEERVIKIVREMVDNEEVPEHKGFFNEPKATKMKRRKKMEANQLTASEVEALEEEYKKRRSQRETEFVSLMSNLEKYCSKPQQAIKGGTKRKAGKTKAPIAAKRTTRSTKK